MRRSFDMVHISHGPFPQDPRPRREALVAAEMGLRVAVVCLRDNDGRPGVGHHRGIAIIRVRGAKRRGFVGRYVVEYLHFVLRARRLIRNDDRLRRAKIIHVHTLPDFLIAAAAPAKRLGALVVLDLHEVFPEFTRSKFRGAIGAIGQRLAEVLERWSRRRADAVVTVNRATESLLRGREARANEWITVIHNTADPRDLGPKRLPTGQVSQPLRLAYHGTLTPLYGLDVAIESVDLAQRLGVDCTLDIYGDGPDAERLRSIVTSHALANRISFRGTISIDALRVQLPTYDAGLIPTRLDAMTRYSLSTKLLEYIHLGVPLIVPRLPTYLMYVPESSAWYFEPNDPGSAAQAIAAFAAAPTQERVRRSRAAQDTTQEVSWERDGPRLRQIYETLLHRVDHPT